MENVSVLVAIGIGMDGHREVIGVAEGMKEDSASWERFVRSMIERGLKGVRLVVGDRYAGLVATVGSMLPVARYQRCMVRFMRDVLSKGATEPSGLGVGGPEGRVRHGVSWESALAKAETVSAEMEARRLKAAANCLREGIGETTTYLLPEFPDWHRRRIRTNDMIERLNREIRRRTRVVGSFPDGNSALMLICVRIRYVTANEWSNRRYLDMSRLDDSLMEANRSSRHGRPRSKVRNLSGTTVSARSTASSPWSNSDTAGCRFAYRRPSSDPRKLQLTLNFFLSNDVIDC